MNLEYFLAKYVPLWYWWCAECSDLDRSDVHTSSGYLVLIFCVVNNS